MQKVDSLTVNTANGVATVAYVGERGSKVWRWTYPDGHTVEQTDVAAMAAYMRKVEVRS
jgi:hypothetical protein